MPNFDTRKVVKICLEIGATILVGWHYAFGSGTALLAGEPERPQNFKKPQHFPLLPSMQVS